jgi:GntR family transcriptional repressor for pyruvate dehydrogenase complex
MALDLEPLGTSRRVDEVFERLRSRIFSGAFKPGEQLPGERELAEALAVNRASVREALKRLEFLELVEVVHGQGTFVRELGASSALQLIENLLRDRRTVSPDLMAQILEFRRDNTLRVVELAARNRSAEQLERARALLEREESEGSDPKCALEIDIEMNTLLGEASGNLLYQFVTNLFTKLIRRLGPLYFNEQRHAGRSCENHRQLLEALEHGDAAEARSIVGVMLGYSEAAILREIDELQARGLIGPDAERSEP